MRPSERQLKLQLRITPENALIVYFPYGLFIRDGSMRNLLSHLNQCPNDMKLVLRVAAPKTEKDRLYLQEAEVDDLKEPGLAYIHIGGMEYVVEVHYDD